MRRRRWCRITPASASPTYYASPLLKSRPGSTHGYDIVDHNKIDPELGRRRTRCAAWWPSYGATTWAWCSTSCPTTWASAGRTIRLVAGRTGMGPGQRVCRVFRHRLGSAGCLAARPDAGPVPGLALWRLPGQQGADCCSSTRRTGGCSSATTRIASRSIRATTPSVLLTDGGPVGGSRRAQIRRAVHHQPRGDVARGQAAARAALRVAGLPRRSRSACTPTTRRPRPGPRPPAPSAGAAELPAGLVAGRDGRDQLAPLLRRERPGRRIRAEVPAVFDDTHRTDPAPLYRGPDRRPSASTTWTGWPTRTRLLPQAAPPAGTRRRTHRPAEPAGRTVRRLWIEKILAPQESSLSADWLTDGTTGYDYMNDVSRPCCTTRRARRR